MRHQNLGKVLRQARVKQGFTQTEVADRLRFSIQFYGKCEKGAVSLPREHLAKAADILGIRRSHLFTAIVRDFSNDLGRWL